MKTGNCNVVYIIFNIYTLCCTDIRLRVRAEYCDHEAALADVTSTKLTQIERQFEMFTRANTILKSRDLGTVVCDIKFSELTYLDAFWRDYINGSLQDALKTVFITGQFVVEDLTGYSFELIRS